MKDLCKHRCHRFEIDGTMLPVWLLTLNPAHQVYGIYNDKVNSFYTSNISCWLAGC
ncbi:hypothetical protein [uncultured Draconibacterium sp.]|uniref:hypothetical protein n=1 Tax=uncultured Draconibacterium sp. TaxID=1573823 RepID=UPI0025D22D6C|nr:hypothetical protein [uncultured Draconibacterium sp.]